MSDLVERLRMIIGTQFTPIETALVTEAADKLEAMQAALEGARDALTPELCDILGITDALNLNRDRGPDAA